MTKLPTFEEEARLQALGFCLVAGVDEVGRGALAGPVMAAAVVLPLGADFPWLKLVRDSKQLSPRQRERVFDLVQHAGIPFGLGSVPHATIDRSALSATLCRYPPAIAMNPLFGAGTMH
jgi:ribonuclease HII